MQRASSRTRSMSSRVQRLTRVRSCARRSALAKTTKKAATGASKRRKSSSTSVSMAEGKLAVIEIEDSSYHLTSAPADFRARWVERNTDLPETACSSNMADFIPRRPLHRTTRQIAVTSSRAVLLPPQLLNTRQTLASEQIARSSPEAGAYFPRVGHKKRQPSEMFKGSKMT